MKLQKQQVKTTYEEWCTMRPFAKTWYFFYLTTYSILFYKYNNKHTERYQNII